MRRYNFFTPQLVIYNKFTAAEPLLKRVNLLCDNISTCVNKFVACRMLMKTTFLCCFYDCLRVFLAHQTSASCLLVYELVIRDVLAKGGRRVWRAGECGECGDRRNVARASFVRGQ